MDTIPSQAEQFCNTTNNEACGRKGRLFIYNSLESRKNGTCQASGSGLIPAVSEGGTSFFQTGGGKSAVTVTANPRKESSGQQQILKSASCSYWEELG